MTLAAVILFVTYFTGACWLFTRPRFSLKTGLSRSTIAALFAARVVAAVSVIMVAKYWFHGTTDYDSYHRFGVLETETLLQNPGKFFSDIFISNYPDTGEVFGSENSYWNDLRTNVIFKVLGLLNLISAKDQYVNALLLCIPAFYANLLLWRVVKHAGFGSVYTMVVCFLFPSMLYYSAGVHKDLFVFMGICVFIYALYFGITDRFSARRIVALLLGLLLVLLIRNFTALLMLPAAFAFWRAHRLPGARRVIGFYLITYLLLIGGAICLHYSAPQLSPFQILADKQQAFLSMRADTDFADTRQLTGSPLNLISAVPAALRHAMFSPLPGEFEGNWHWFFAAEWILLYASIIWFCLGSRKLKSDKPVNVGLFLCSFSGSLLLVIGLITPAAGALVRYRSVPLSLFAIGLALLFSRKT